MQEVKATPVPMDSFAQTPLSRDAETGFFNVNGPSRSQKQLVVYRKAHRNFYTGWESLTLMKIVHLPRRE
jgi:hypothetical protein